MKKFQILQFLFVIAAITLVNASSAQTSFHAAKTFREPVTTAAAKTNSRESKISKADLNFRIMKRFARIFPNIKDETWVKTPQGFLVRFNENGISTSAFLNNGGLPDAIIRYYNENQLPPEVRTLVKRSYFDFTIIGVTEVTYYTNTAENIKAYLVTIDKKDSWKIIRVVDGDMDVYQFFSKQ